MEYRSDSIHNMANKCYKMKGVWKIGNKHAKHIKTTYPNRKYKLIDVGQFNDSFYREYPDLNPNSKPPEEFPTIDEDRFREMMDNFPPQIPLLGKRKESQVFEKEESANKKPRKW